MAVTFQDLQGAAVRPELGELEEAVRRAKAGDEEGQIQLCGAMLWASFACPEAIFPVFDALFRAQLALDCRLTELPMESAPPPDAFWERFQETIEGPEGGYDATSITVAVASLGGELHSEMANLSESAARILNKEASPESKTAPPMITLEGLASLPEGSLGRALLAMWTDNQFDPEVLDRDAIGLADLSPALRYLNTRILQMHDVWHLVAGYRTTSLHEMAISSFQLAQFGHNYSAMFLATVLCMSCLRQPAGFPLLMQNFAEGWRHGCQAPKFMEIEWESEWHLDIASIRQKYGIEPFAGSFPENLLEQLTGSA
ncbi:MAG: Coq4 family protein [Pseudomonadota bacterium]|nr:Coq4 family protein [Pseudomonadota bacterium]